MTDYLIQTARINCDRNQRYYDEDEKVSETIFADTPRDELAGEVFRWSRSEYGRCTGKVYVDTSDRGTLHVGWVFVKREEYSDWNSSETYLCETWVTLAEIVREPETIPGEIKALALS